MAPFIFCGLQGVGYLQKDKGDSSGVMTLLYSASIGDNTTVWSAEGCGTLYWEGESLSVNDTLTKEG